MLVNFVCSHLFYFYKKDIFVVAFVQEFRNWESTWGLEALFVIVYEIRVLVEKADRQLASNRKSSEKLKGVGSLLMKVFGILVVCKYTHLYGFCVTYTSLLH
ncbi:hypothetical protein RYX36_012745 [Vicia faba]